MDMTQDLENSLSAFRRAATNGQPLMALEFLVPVVDALMAEATKADAEEDEPTAVEVSDDLKARARTASSRKVTKAADSGPEEPTDGEDG